MNLHALSKDFEKIITSPSLQLRCFLIGLKLNESSHHRLFKTVLLFQKFKLFHKLSLLLLCDYGKSPK